MKSEGGRLMYKGKLIYIDFYKPNFGEDDISVIDVKHLKALEIFTYISVQEIVFKLKQLIIEKYSDGLYITAEEFDSICYLNVSVHAGEDISSMCKYLDAISHPNIEDKEDAVIEVNEDLALFSVDYVEDKDIEEFTSHLYSLGFDISPYMEGQSAFERGAGDYRQIITFIFNSFATGIFNSVGEKALDKVVSKFEGLQNPRAGEVNINIIMDFISTRSSVNERDLRIIEISHLNDIEQEVKVTSRYKNFILRYNCRSKSITRYEEKPKSQTMI